MTLKRSWIQPRAKVEQDDRCRYCLRGPGCDAAHIIARSRVRPGAGENPNNVVALCREHHREYDEHQLDLLPLLTLEEQAYAVSLVGIVAALERLTSSKWLPC